MLCNNSYLDEILALANYALTVDEWKKWLAKPQWSAAEAAALSLGMSPVFIRVIKNEVSIPIIRFNDGLDKPQSLNYHYKIKLAETALAAGRSIEAEINHRASGLAGCPLDHIGSQWNQGQWDFNKPAGTPGRCVEQMQYWEWTMPMAMLGKAEPQYSDTLMLPEIALALGVSVNDLRVIVESGYFVKVYGEGGEQWKTNEVISWAKANGRSFDLAKLPPPKPLSEEQQKYGSEMGVKEIAVYLKRTTRTVQKYIDANKLPPADFPGIGQGSKSVWITVNFVEKYKAMQKTN